MALSFQVPACQKKLPPTCEVNEVKIVLFSSFYSSLDFSLCFYLHLNPHVKTNRGSYVTFFPNLYMKKLLPTCGDSVKNPSLC